MEIFVGAWFSFLDTLHMDPNLYPRTGIEEGGSQVPVWCVLIILNLKSCNPLYFYSLPY